MAAPRMPGTVASRRRPLGEYSIANVEPLAAPRGRPPGENWIARVELARSFLERRYEGHTNELLEEARTALPKSGAKQRRDLRRLREQINKRRAELLHLVLSAQGKAGDKFPRFSHHLHSLRESLEASMKAISPLDTILDELRSIEADSRPAAKIAIASFLVCLDRGLLLPRPSDLVAIEVAIGSEGASNDRSVRRARIDSRRKLVKRALQQAHDNLDSYRFIRLALTGRVQRQPRLSEKQLDVHMDDRLKKTPPIGRPSSAGRSRTRR